MKTQFLFASLMSAVILFSSCDEDHQKANYVLNSESSVAEWKGSTSNVYHDGSFSVSGSNLLVEDGKLKSGTFTIPIASIKNFDLPDNIKPVLLDHLKSPDFFNMVMYPNAKFTITKVSPYTGSYPSAVEGANYTITGDFTMIGQTRSISFPARIVLMDDAMTAEARFTIDRTEWGMDYAADPALGDHYIFPEVDIHLKVFGNKTISDR